MAPPAGALEAARLLTRTGAPWNVAHRPRERTLRRWVSVSTAGLLALGLAGAAYAVLTDRAVPPSLVQADWLAAAPAAAPTAGASADPATPEATPEAPSVAAGAPIAAVAPSGEKPHPLETPAPPNAPTPALLGLAPSLDLRLAAPAGPVVAYAPTTPLSETPASGLAIDAPLPPPRPAAPAAPAAPMGFKKGAAAFVRIFKKEGELELWLKKDGRLALYKTYPVCKWSGALGPKLKMADYQSPEGFYMVSAKQLKPDSAYHRAFNIGYPNAYDKQHSRTGGLIMVHGDCKSVGCFAMTNAGVEEIYDLVAAAVRGGQKEMPVHVFPFRMSAAALARETPNGFASVFSAAPGKSWADFWTNLKEGYDLFETTGEPPTAYACAGKYVFNASTPGCARIAGW